MFSEFYNIAKLQEVFPSYSGSSRVSKPRPFDHWILLDLPCFTVHLAPSAPLRCVSTGTLCRDTYMLIIARCTPTLLSAHIILLIYGPGMSRSFWVLCSSHPPLFMHPGKVFVCPNPPFSLSGYLSNMPRDLIGFITA